MEKRYTHTHSLLRTFKYSWANVVQLYIQLNIEQVTSVAVDEGSNLILNGNTYKLDVANYTGHSERYIFFNPTSGRLVIETSGKQRVYKLDVDLLDW
jgi:hypothetical protein